MPLKDYTTEVSAMKSIGQIQGNLVAHGAKEITVNYSPNREPEGLSFTVPTRQGDIPFLLPVNVKKVEAILLNMRARKPETWDYNYAQVMERIQKRAVMVAWRITKDWVDAQLAFIETEMVTLDEVFLPYMEVKGGQRLYELMVNKGYLLGEGHQSP